MAPKPNSGTFFSHINVSADASLPPAASGDFDGSELAGLMRSMLAEQRRQSELLEELVQQVGAAQRQRANELIQWKEANPYLARQCRRAAEALGNIQTEFLRHLTEEITDRSDDFLDGEFLLNEFVDRYGPRLAHLNGVLQVLSQLSSMPTAGATS